MKKTIALSALVLALAAAPAGAQLQINGYLSFEYRKGEAQSDVPRGEFGRARGGLFFTGQLEKAFDYRLEVRLDGPDRIGMEEAWVGYLPSEAFHLKLGMYLVPFGVYNTSGRPYETPLVGRPLLQEALYPESWRDLGALVEGRTGMFQYAAYLGNGLSEAEDLAAGQQFRDNNRSKAVGGRLSLNLSRGFEAGGSYHRSRFDEAGERALTLWGAHVTWVTEGFRFLYEYGQAGIENPAGFDDGQARGHLVLGSINLAGFLPVVSYQQLDYDDLYHGAGFSSPPGAAGAGIAAAGSRWTAGLVFTPIQSVMIKLEYDFNKEKPADIENDLFLAQVAIRF